jgi:hypothetical protein
VHKRMQERIKSGLIFFCISLLSYIFAPSSSLRPVFRPRQDTALLLQVFGIEETCDSSSHSAQLDVRRKPETPTGTTKPETPTGSHPASLLPILYQCTDIMIIVRAMNHIRRNPILLLSSLSHYVSLFHLPIHRMQITISTSYCNPALSSLVPHHHFHPSPSSDASNPPYLHWEARLPVSPPSKRYLGS